MMLRLIRRMLGDPDDFLNGKTPARRKLLTVLPSQAGERKLPASRPGFLSGKPGRES